MDTEDQTQDEQDAAAREPGSDEDQAAEKATEGDQGEQVAAPASAAGFDPDREVRTSPPAPTEQSGVPGLPENEGVEPGEAAGQPEVSQSSPAEGDQGGSPAPDAE